MMIICLFCHTIENLSPASASMGSLCRWRSIQRGQKRWWRSRCQWGHTGRWWSCLLSERCTGPASTSPILPLPAGWLLLSARWGTKKMKRTEQALYLLPYYNSCVFGSTSKVEEEEDQGGTKNEEQLECKEEESEDGRQIYLEYRIGITCFMNMPALAQAREDERPKEKRANQRSSLIRGETLPPVAPLFAFQMKAVDKRACCTRQLKQRGAQLGMLYWHWKVRERRVERLLMIWL